MKNASIMLDHQPPAVVFERLPDGDAVVRLYDNIKDAADVAQPGETDPEQEPGSAYLADEVIRLISNNLLLSIQNQQQSNAPIWNFTLSISWNITKRLL